MIHSNPRSGCFSNLVSKFNFYNVCTEIMTNNFFQKLENAPKVTAESLAEKQRRAEERKQKVS